MADPRRRPAHESSDYSRPDETLSHRVARLDERLKAEQTLRADHEGRVLAELGILSNLIREESGTCREARDAAREASAQCAELGRRMDRFERDRDRDTDRYAPVAVREFGSSPISVPTHPTPVAVDPEAGGVHVKATLSSKQLVAIILGALGGGVGLTKVIELALGGGG